MSTTEETHSVDRTGWASGPWDGEPDKIQFTTKAGLPGLITRNHMGTLCGYVGVAEEHPYFEVGYDDDGPSGLDCHGGLTYSNHCAGHICHVPEPGQPDNVWWFGFDCGHSCDLMPYMTKLGLGPRRGEYRDVAYVREQVEALAEQLLDAVIREHDRLTAVGP